MRRVWSSLLVMCMVVCMIVSVAPAAEASVLSDFSEDAIASGTWMGTAVVEAGVFLAKTVTDPDGMSMLYVAGDRASNQAVGTQLKFGSYEGKPFLLNAGVLTDEPSQGRVVLGLGTSVGSIGTADINGYVELGPDELSSTTLKAVGLDNWAVCLGVGLSWEL